MKPFAYERAADSAGAVAAVAAREGSKFLGGGTNLVDLMKLLQASVKAATDDRAKGSPAPVSVADAKRERAARPATSKSTPAAPKAKPVFGRTFPARAWPTTPTRAFVPTIASEVVVAIWAGCPIA